MLHSPHHHPPHVFKDNSIYFITARTINRQPYFNTDKKKQILRLCLKAGLQKFSISLCGWVILPNHYHLLVKLVDSTKIPKFIQHLNGKSSFDLNKFDNQRGRKIWFQYWDRCIRTHKDFFKRLNYIHQNPVKHRYVKNMADYQSSSYQTYLKKYGLGWLNQCFAEYPIIDFSLPED